MLPLILVAVGAYLIGDSVLEDKKYAKGGQLDAKSAKKRLEQLRKELRAERISYDELAELESLKEYIDEDDVELRQAAGIPEFDEDEYKKGGKTQGYDDKEDERLAMEHGKMAKKDLDSTHARRDDAEFEERGKMAKGGMLEHGMKQGDKIKGSFDNVVIVENGGKIFVVNLNTGKRWSESAWVSANHGNDSILAKMKDGGYMAKGGETPSDWDEKMKNAQQTLAFLKKEYENNPTPKMKKSVSNFEEYIKKLNQNKYAKGGKLVGKQKNLDVNKNGKLDAEDFKMLRGEKMAKGGETKMPYKEFEETLREYEIEGGFGKTKEKGYEMYYLPNGNPYLNTKFNHRNKKKAYQQYVKMDR